LSEGILRRNPFYIKYIEDMNILSDDLLFDIISMNPDIMFRIKKIYMNISKDLALRVLNKFGIKFVNNIPLSIKEDPDIIELVKYNKFYITEYHLLGIYSEDDLVATVRNNPYAIIKIDNLNEASIDTLKLPSHIRTEIASAYPRIMKHCTPSNQTKEMCDAAFLADKTIFNDLHYITADMLKQVLEETNIEVHPKQVAKVRNDLSDGDILQLVMSHKIDIGMFKKKK